MKINMEYEYILVDIYFIQQKNPYEIQIHLMYLSNELNGHHVHFVCLVT